MWKRAECAEGEQLTLSTAIHFPADGTYYANADGRAMYASLDFRQ